MNEYQNAWLAKSVATGLRLSEMPSAAKAARPTLMDLKPLASLSIIKNGPKNFAGRTVGILITDGVDSDILGGLVNALKQEKAAFKLIAPQVGGVKASNGKIIPADEKIGGGPSVLFDAIALLPSKEGVDSLSKDPAVRDFVADALSHRKFVAYLTHVEGLLEKAGVDTSNRSQLVLLDQVESAKSFVTQCRDLRRWPE